VNDQNIEPSTKCLLYLESSSQQIETALENLYGKNDIFLQQLAATFRGGELIAYLV
jgi:hypothetical protein